MYDSEVHGPVVTELAQAVMYRTGLPDNAAMQSLRRELTGYEHEQPFMDFVAHLSEAVSDINTTCLAEVVILDRLYTALGYEFDGRLPQIILIRPRVWPNSAEDTAASVEFSERAVFLIFGGAQSSFSAISDWPRFTCVDATKRPIILDALFELGVAHQTNEHFFTTMQQRLPILQQAFDKLLQLPTARSPIAKELYQEIKTTLDDAQEQIESMGVISPHHHWNLQSAQMDTAFEIAYLYARIDALAASMGTTLGSVIADV